MYLSLVPRHSQFFNVVVFCVQHWKIGSAWGRGYMYLCTTAICHLDALGVIKEVSGHYPYQLMVDLLGHNNKKINCLSSCGYHTIAVWIAWSRWFTCKSTWDQGHKGVLGPQTGVNSKKQLAVRLAVNVHCYCHCDILKWCWAYLLIIINCDNSVHSRVITYTVD